MIGLTEVVNRVGVVALQEDERVSARLHVRSDYHQAVAPHIVHGVAADEGIVSANGVARHGHETAEPAGISEHNVDASAITGNEHVVPAARVIGHGACVADQYVDRASTSNDQVVAASRVIGHGASIAAQELVSTSTGSSNYPVVTAPAGVFHHEGVAAGYLSLIRTIHADQHIVAAPRGVVHRVGVAQEEFEGGEGHRSAMALSTCRWSRDPCGRAFRLGCWV